VNQADISGILDEVEAICGTRETKKTDPTPRYWPGS